jgi:UDP-N-acetylmuramoyl-tripeptide--D-alanyl-D-alanine ligase
VRATAIDDRGLHGTSARVTTRAGAFDLVTKLIGRGNLANVLAAIAVALEFGIPLAAMGEHAARLRPASHRGQVWRLARGGIVIDDSYNANPTAMKQAIDLLASTDAHRRVAVLGEMLELGEFAGDLHADIGRAVAQAGIDLLIAVGGAPAATLADAAVKAGMAPDRVTHVATSEQAADAIDPLIAVGDVVLVKGSRGVKTERVVERLKAERG